METKCEIITWDGKQNVPFKFCCREINFNLVNGYFQFQMC